MKKVRLYFSRNHYKNKNMLKHNHNSQTDGNHMSREIFADLHNHTTASDGDYSPEALIKSAKSLGIKAVGVTDHDTINGVESAMEAGKQYGIEVVPGVEVSIRFKEPGFTGTLHLLCYFKSERLGDHAFKETMRAVLAGGRGESLVRARVKEINRVFGPKGKQPRLKRGMRYEDISALSDNASRRHFALVLNQTFGIEAPSEVNKIIGNDSPAYLPAGIGFEAAADLVSQQDLLAVLAHPAAGSFPGKGHYKDVLPPIEVVEGLLPRFLDAGIKGIEVYYPGHIRAHEQVVEGWAGKYGLLVTGGSDCHDAVHRPLGMAGISESQFNLFKAELR